MPKIVITAENIPEILHLIETWKGKLTWPLLCEDIMVMLQLDNVTRQTLSGYKQIQNAYTDRKQYLRENKDTEAPQINNDIEYWKNQVESLEVELKRANKINEMYKQRFVLWQHNAYIHGVRMESLDDAVEMLDKPLTEIKRRTGGA